MTRRLLGLALVIVWCGAVAYVYDPSDGTAGYIATLVMGSVGAGLIGWVFWTQP